jgi:hypothetical protein
MKNINKKIYISVIAIVLLLCLILFGLGLFLDFSVTKSIKFVISFWLVFGACAVISIIGSAIYNKLYDTKYGETIIVILFFVILIAVCVLAGLLK